MTREATVSAYPVKPHAKRLGIVRAFCVAAVMFALGYVTLPVWLPTGLLARKLAYQLSADLGRPVSIEDVTVGWMEGVVVRDIRIADRPDDASPFLARIDEVRCDFTPVVTLWTGRVRRLQVCHPEVWLVVDEAGRVNIQDLGGQEGRRLPSLHYGVRGLTCHVWTPAVAQTFVIDSIECELEPTTGLLRLGAAAMVRRPEALRGDIGTGTSEQAGLGPNSCRLAIDAQVKVARLKPGERLSGEAHVDWSNLSLRDLPVPLISHLPVSQVAGTSSGHLRFVPGPDLGVDFDLDVALNGVEITRMAVDRPAKVPDADFRCSGHWDPTADTVRLDQFAYATPAIRVEKAGGLEGAPVIVDRGGDVPLDLHLEGQVKDWSALGREFPDASYILRSAGVTLEGRADFNVRFVERRDVCEFALKLGGDASEWTVASGASPYLRVAAGVPKSLHLECRYNRRTGELKEQAGAMRVGGVSLSTKTQAVVPEFVSTGKTTASDVLVWLETLGRTLTSYLKIEADDLQEVASFLPCLAETLQLRGMGGPIRIEAQVEPDEKHSCMDVRVVAGPDVKLHLGELLEKPTGHSLTLTIRGQLPGTGADRIDDWECHLRHGDGRIVFRTKGEGLAYRLTRLDGVEWGHQAFAWDVLGNVELRGHRIEGVLSLWPGWHDLQAAGIPRNISGSFKATSQVTISGRPDDWLTRFEVSCIADDLFVRWDDMFAKPAGVPFSVTLSHNAHWLPEERQQSLRAEIKTVSGEVFSSVTLANAETGRFDASWPGMSFEELVVRADIGDVESWLSLMPSLADTLDLWRPTGAVSFGFEHVRVGDWGQGSLYLDGTGADLVASSGLEVFKPAGVDAVAELGWEVDSTPSVLPEQVWKVSEGRIRLAGMNVDELSGRVLTTLPVELNAASLRSRLPSVKRVRLIAKGEVVVNDALKKLHPKMGGWIESLDLEGRAFGDIVLDADVAAACVGIRGQFNGAPMKFAFPTGHAVAPRVCKPIATPALLSFDVFLAGMGDDSTEVHIDDLSVTLDGNSAQLAGRLCAPSWLGFSEDASGTDVSVEAGSITLQVDHSDRLLRLLPDSAIDVLDGRLEGTLTATSVNGEFEFGPTRLSLNDFVIGIGADPLQVTGELAFRDKQLNIEQLQYSLGQTSGAVSATLSVRDDRDHVRAGFVLDHLDLNDLVTQIGAFASIAGSVMSPTPSSVPSEPTRGLMEVIGRLRRADVSIDAHVGSAAVTLPLGIDAILDAGTQQMTVQNGEARLTFECIADGGLVTGSVETNLNVADPTYYLKYVADSIQPGDLVNRYLSRTFPGMVATGPLTLIDETYRKLVPKPGDPNFDVGKGEILIEGGTIEGRAAPLGVTRIFPGLNLARFEFSYMHSWFDKLPGGVVRHQMIFQGRYYNVYMIGETDPTQRMRYEVGIDFLADFDSKYWADSGQGRIPLFIKTGTIREDGTLANERVTYMSPTRILETLLIRNNPVVTAYHAVRKRVLTQE